jgi:hypothetical protein|nr:MAG TPA: E2 glycoprotein [Caudoviricetes sp.]
MVDKIKELDERAPTLKDDPAEDDRVPKLKKNFGAISTSKGRYAGHRVGGSKGSARGRMYAKQTGITIQRNADET